MKEAESRARGVPGCPGCVELAAKLDAAMALIAELRCELDAAKRRIRELEERLGSSSRNSSLPPSKDPPGAPRRAPRKPSGRRPGGQPGHQGSKRDPLPPESVDQFVAHRRELCERCGTRLPKRPQPKDPPPIRHQVFEMRERLWDLTEHQAQACACPACGLVNRGVIPSEVVVSSFGPRLTATASFLTGNCQLSRRLVEEVFEGVLGIPIALGTISNLEQEVSQALEPSHREALEAVAEAPVKHVDETGWKQRRQTRWLWTAATATLACFVIHASRGLEGLRALLAQIHGTFITDRWGVYSTVRGARDRQICWAHLIRDFQKLIDLGGSCALIGRRAKRISKRVFVAWRAFKAGEIGRAGLQLRLCPLRHQLKEILQRGTRLRHRKAATFCRNILKLETALWTFSRRDGVEPTNNHAERVIRRGVLWRTRSFGSVSDRGCTFVARVLTVVQSCRLQRRSALNFITTAVEAHRFHSQPPSLLKA